MSFKEVRELKTHLNTPIIIFDTETTGLSADECDIIEFSAQKVRVKEDGTYEVADEIDIFINPGYPLPEKIVEITGITDELLVKEGIPQKKAYEKIRAFFGEDSVIAGYNVGFDIKFIEALYRKNEDTFSFRYNFDVLQMVREQLPKPHKLINACENLGIADKFQFHRSIDDARATTEILFSLIGRYSDEPDPLTVTGVQRWAKHGFNRIYVSNDKNYTIFFDVNLGTWTFNGDVDGEKVIRSVYDLVGVANDEELNGSV